MIQQGSIGTAYISDPQVLLTLRLQMPVLTVPRL